MKDWLAKISPRTRLFAGIAFVVMVLDQWTKYLAVAGLTRVIQDTVGSESALFDRIIAFYTYGRSVAPSLRGSAYEILRDFWHFRYVENPGAAWGFLAGSAAWFRTPFFLLVSVAAMVFIVVYFRRTETHQKILRVALALVFGGAIGNFIDRVRLSYVIDFIDWHWFDKATWPTFNVADAAISVGVILLLLDMKLSKAPGDNRTSEASEKPA